ncbi:hypothetical protein [Nocardioides currus]|uniref:Uncharacterized protein n=1 Tax=Nocardioides currus TaxID=2133958 RepID=A0A2R7YRL7_9ACTN|nr:hypothetical protein [Nocardioides currus]PUA79022.1 hypothetical protein C7S10_21345 [Nocardioides currus]
MKTSTRLTALAGATALVAAPLTVLAMAPANADVDRNGRCGAGVYELSVDRERGGYDVDAGIDGVKPFSRWTFTLTHDGKRLTKVTRTADDEGEVDVDAFAKNTRGKDTFAFTATSGAAKCGTSITVA